MTKEKREFFRERPIINPNRLGWMIQIPSTPECDWPKYPSRDAARLARERMWDRHCSEKMFPGTP